MAMDEARAVEPVSRDAARRHPHGRLHARRGWTKGDSGLPTLVRGRTNSRTPPHCEYHALNPRHDKQRVLNGGFDVSSSKPASSHDMTNLSARSSID